jgi:hypothetical protein
MNAKTALALGATSVVFLNVGAAIGYFFAKEKLGKEFDERLEREVAAAKKFYSKLHKRDEHDITTIVETPESLPVEREAIQAMKMYQGHKAQDDASSDEEIEYETVKTHTGEEIVENNIFDSSPNDVENYEDLVMSRDENSPYILTLAEYMNNDPDHEQSSLVYFQTDGILVDERDEVVEDPDKIVGDDNLVRFGHFSGDPKVVYVRNLELQHDFEITRHEGSYAFVVHGIINDQNKHTVSAGG